MPFDNDVGVGHQDGRLYASIRQSWLLLSPGHTVQLASRTSPTFLVPSRGLDLPLTFDV